MRQGTNLYVSWPLLMFVSAYHTHACVLTVTYHKCTQPGTVVTCFTCHPHHPTLQVHQLVQLSGLNGWNTWTTSFNQSMRNISGILFAWFIQMGTQSYVLYIDIYTAPGNFQRVNMERTLCKSVSFPCYIQVGSIVNSVYVRSFVFHCCSPYASYASHWKEYKKMREHTRLIA
jgi:hypothetical protein